MLSTDLISEQNRSSTEKQKVVTNDQEFARLITLFSERDIAGNGTLPFHDIPHLLDVWFGGCFLGQKALSNASSSHRQAAIMINRFCIDRSTANAKMSCDEVLRLARILRDQYNITPSLIETQQKIYGKIFRKVDHEISDTEKISDADETPVRPPSGSLVPSMSPIPDDKNNWSPQMYELFRRLERQKIELDQTVELQQETMEGYVHALRQSKVEVTRMKRELDQLKSVCDGFRKQCEQGELMRSELSSNISNLRQENRRLLQRLSVAESKVKYLESSEKQNYLNVIHNNPLSNITTTSTTTETSSIEKEIKEAYVAELQKQVEHLDSKVSSQRQELEMLRSMSRQSIGTEAESLSLVSSGSALDIPMRQVLSKQSSQEIVSNVFGEKMENLSQSKDWKEVTKVDSGPILVVQSTSRFMLALFVVFLSGLITALFAMENALQSAIRDDNFEFSSVIIS